MKEKLQDLINYFHNNKEEFKKEANTKTKLIEPLFEILGWDRRDLEKEASARRGEKGGLVDYSFKIGDKIAFFLEAKAVGVSLDKEADKQAVSYALSKRIPFAVSTNFEELKIFCVEQKGALQNKFRVFSKPEDYIERLHDLMLLSRESFEKDETLKMAASEGRLKERITIDQVLLDDLMEIRRKMFYEIEKNHPQKYEPNEKDE
ncbi:MAG: hypothetical protein V1911_00870, partial [Candidatus Micrarchaeota archaeon]